MKNYLEVSKKTFYWKKLMKNILKRLPPIKKFIRKHNLDLYYIFKKIGYYPDNLSVIIDVGANVGQTIEYYLNINRRINIYSFEPTKNLFNDLKKKYKGKENIHLFEIALSDYKGSTELFTSEYSATNSIFNFDLETYRSLNSPITDKISKTGKQICIVDTLDNLITERKLIVNKIDILKIDNQGSEYNTITGALNTLKGIKMVILELQYLNFYLGVKPFYETIKLLYENEFYLLTPFAINRISDIQWIESDAVFLNKKFFPIGKVFR